MNHILHHKEKQVFIITKSLHQNPNIKAQASDENSTNREGWKQFFHVFSDNMLLSKQGSNIDLFFTRVSLKNIDIYYISQSYFHLPKNTFLNNPNINNLFKQTFRDIILIFRDIAGLDVNLKE